MRDASCQPLTTKVSADMIEYWFLAFVCDLNEHTIMIFVAEAETVFWSWMWNCELIHRTHMYCLQCHRGYAGHDFSLVSELELRMHKMRRPALFCGIECEKLLHSFQSTDSTAEHMIALASTSAPAAPEHLVGLLHNLNNASCSMVCLLG